MVKDYDVAVQWYKRAASQNHAKAKKMLDGIFNWEYGIALNDNSEIFNWYHKLAHKEDIYGCFALGNSYYLGKGVEMDYAEAAKWYLKAAKMNHVKSQYMIGLLYYYGDGVKKDINESVKWLKRASGQDYYLATEKLKKMGISTSE